jgi:hypothetical protein
MEGREELIMFTNAMMGVVRCGISSRGGQRSVWTAAAATAGIGPPPPQLHPCKVWHGMVPGCAILMQSP